MTSKNPLVLFLYRICFLDTSLLPILVRSVADFVVLPNDTQLLQTFRVVRAQLWVPLAEEKTTGTCQTIIYLGLEIDSVKQEIRVPVHKVQALRVQIQAILEWRKLSL